MFEWSFWVLLFLCSHHQNRGDMTVVVEPLCNWIMMMMMMMMMITKIEADLVV